MSEIVGICGSARKKGNTSLLLQEVLHSTGMKSELIFLSDLRIGFCTGCLRCRENKGKCPQDDDMHLLFDKVFSSKALVLGSPNYYYDVSGLMKNMIDRSIAWCYLGIGEDTGTAWHGWRPFAGKVCGLVIAQAAYGGEKALETFDCFAEWTGLEQAGSVIASVGAETVQQFPEYSEQARVLGKTMREKVVQKRVGPSPYPTRL